MSREMKHSGIPWIGDIPRGWAVCRIKDVASLYNGNSIKDEEKDNYTNDDNAYPYISTKDIDATYQSINYNNGLYTQKDDNTFKIAYADSSLMCIEGGSAGKKKAYVEQNVSFVNKLCCFAPDKISGKYLFYSLCSPHFESDFSKYISGLIGGVSVSTLKNFKQIVPSLEEQQKIASFLDRKCAEIDEMIALQEKIVEELKAYKQSVITEAVTKGLNPDVPMKDSGTDWIGEIPEHWKMCRVKDILEAGKDGIKIGPFGSSLTNKVNGDGECKIYGQWNIVNKDFTAGKNFVSAETYKELDAYKIVAGDILVSMMGTIGKCAIIPNGLQDGIMDSHVIKIRINKNIINPEFFELMYDKDNSTFIFEQLSRMKKGSIMDGLNSSIIKRLNLLLPPIDEQQEIVSYLLEKRSKIDNLISIKLSKIDSLKEYKKSIIYEYVTGKKEVTE